MAALIDGAKANGNQKRRSFGVLTHCKGTDGNHKPSMIDAMTVEERPYLKQEVTTRDVFLFHQLGTEKMPARPIITDLEKNDIEDIRRLIDKKTKHREERFYKRWYDAFMKSIRFLWQ